MGKIIFLLLFVSPVKGGEMEIRMNGKENYYLEKYKKLTVLSSTPKCETILAMNIDTNQVVVFKSMEKHAYDVYEKLIKLNNFNVVKVEDCFMHDDKCIAVEEFINGIRLSDILADKIDIKLIADYIRQICNGLKDVHELGIVHRDLQPKNIVITSENNLKIIDFDIARIKKENASNDTELWGTAGYAAPEQFGFAQTDERSDIYSLGVIIDEMIKPYAESVNVILNGEEQKSITKLSKISKKCKEMDPENRYKSIEEILKQLRMLQRKENLEDKSIAYEEKMNLDNVIRTIPGYRSKNKIYMFLATAIYSFLIYMFFVVGSNMENTKTGFDIITAILIECAIFLPYAYLVNIGNMVYKFRGRKFQYKIFEYIHRVVVAAFIFVFIIIFTAAITQK